MRHTKPVPKPKRQRKSTRGSFLSSTWQRLPAALPHRPSARAYLPRPALKPRGQISNTPIPNVDCDEHRALHTISSTIHRLRSLFLEMLCAGRPMPSCSSCRRMSSRGADTRAWFLAGRPDEEGSVSKKSLLNSPLWLKPMLLGIRTSPASAVGTSTFRSRQKLCRRTRLSTSGATLPSRSSNGFQRMPHLLTYISSRETPKIGGQSRMNDIETCSCARDL